MRTQDCCSACPWWLWALLGLLLLLGLLSGLLYAFSDQLGLTKGNNGNENTGDNGNKGTGDNGTKVTPQPKPDPEPPIDDNNDDDDNNTGNNNNGGKGVIPE